MAVRGFFVCGPVTTGYSAFKGLICLFLEVYFRFKGLLPKYPRSKTGQMTWRSVSAYSVSEPSPAP